MRILLTADPHLPVPPRGYGGIERVVALLADELAARGHQVTLVAHPDSRTAATLIPYGPSPPGGTGRARTLAALALAVWQHRHAVDVVHSFGRLAALLPILSLAVGKVQSYQRAVPWTSVRRAARLAGASLLFTGCSASLHRTAQPSHGRWQTVYNPVDTRRFHPCLRVAADAPLVFLGRLEAIKGVGEAIAIARGAGRRLVIAGNRLDDGEGRRYFDEVIAPALDGDRICYLGEIDDERKQEVLGGAAALLMPVQWDEPFGIVMAEALACGTPVIGLNRGSVGEVVRDGRTGYVCASVAEAVAAVARLPAIDRRACRADAEARFGVVPIVDAYERLYRMVAGGGA